MTQYRLNTPTARGELSAQDEPYWVPIVSGMAIGYRRGKRFGTWYVRTFERGRYRKTRIAVADDVTRADGRIVLNYHQAVKRAMEMHFAGTA